MNTIYIYCFNHHDQPQGYYLDSKAGKIMTCNCKNHLEEFTCSGVGCQVCVLGEENYIENPELPEERYCLKCAMKKAGFQWKSYGN
ncbi:MAG: hypothetical protein OEL84_00585 [Nitrosopumilus sp.]|nr:hypothetical protein [Nitrosopumilus sp.]